MICKHPRVVAVVALLAILASCGGGRSPHTVPALNPAASPAFSSQQLPRETTLDEALAQLETLPTPEGVDESLFSELKSALREALVYGVGARHAVPLHEEEMLLGSVGRGFIPAEEGTARLKSRPTQGIKIVSKPPTGLSNLVIDLELIDNGDGTYSLTWHYRNTGDYNQDGIVNIMDVTPLAVHFNEEADETNEWIDGNGDTVIDIKDVTPLAAGFFNTVDHYEVEASHLDFGPWNFAASAPLLEVSGERMRLSYDLGSSPAFTFWRVVPVDAEGKRGEPSNVASLAIEQPVEIIAVNPLGGVAGSEVAFVATVLGNPPFDFEWDFGGGATPDEVSGLGFEVSAEVTLAVVGQYDASLYVENAEGNDTKNFTLTVTEIPGIPPQILSVTPTEGDSGTEVTFTTEVTGDAPLSYEWNFGGGASPNLLSGVRDEGSGEITAAVTLGRGGTLWERTKLYPARVTVSNEWGSTTYPFDLGVTAHWHIEKPDFYGSSVQLKFKKDGTPVIAYQYDVGPGDLGLGPKLALKEGGEWIRQIPDENAQLSGYSISLALDSQGNPALAYNQYGEFKLKYAHFDGVNWSIEVVEPVRTEILSFALGPGDLPTVLYAVYGSTTQMFGFREAGGWTITPIPELSSARSLAYTGDGHPALIGIKPDDEGTYYAQYMESGWTFERMWDQHIYGDLAFAGSTPMMAWPSLYLAVREDSGWSVEDIGRATYPVSLAVDPQGRAAIAYPHVRQSDVPPYEEWPMVTYFDGESWQSEVIEEVQTYEIQLAFDPHGSAAVVYDAFPVGAPFELRFAYLW